MTAATVAAVVEH